MKWNKLLEITKSDPVFSANLLIAGDESPKAVAKQLCLWVKAGKLSQVRRGWYAVSEPYRTASLSHLYVASSIKKAAYVSLQAALYYYNMIPEYVPVVTCVTTGRPERIKNPAFPILYKHIKPELFWGYKEVEVAPGQYAFIATPEKALCDLIYLTPGADDRAFISELRLEHLDTLDILALQETAARFGGRKMAKSVRLILNQESEDKDYVEV